MTDDRPQNSIWLESEFDRTGRRRRDLAQKLGLDASAVSKMISGKRDISADEMILIKDFFGSETDRWSDRIIEEIDVRAGMGGGGISLETFEQDRHGMLRTSDAVRFQWRIPSTYVRNELHSQPNNLKIIEGFGDSMEPTLKTGDKVVINVLHKIPSPPGVYAVWDGYGVVVKRIESVPLTSPPMVRLISDNPSHAAYEVSLADANIIGRVVCKISIM